MKSKGEKERYTHLNAEFQRIARRDKQAFLSDQCKEIEETNRLGKIIEISLRKLEIPRDISCKDRHNEGQKWCMDPKKAEDSKKRWQEHTENCTKKDLHDPDNHEGVITQLEPDILECEVKWALGSISTTKLVEVMEFQLSYFKS